tara:strand:+ start:2526 stop:2861 length:336 start_codon:yes stop_codon:yes gene_type:complete
MLRNSVLHGAEPVSAVFARAEHAAQVEIGLNALLLDVVETIVIGLPDVDDRALHRIALRIRDAPTDQHVFALLVEADIGSHLALGRSGNVERAEHGGFRRSLGARKAFSPR